jgi:hypothetical protein
LWAALHRPVLPCPTDDGPIDVIGGQGLHLGGSGSRDGRAGGLGIRRATRDHPGRVGGAAVPTPPGGRERWALRQGAADRAPAPGSALLGAYVGWLGRSASWGCARWWRRRDSA